MPDEERKKGERDKRGLENSSVNSSRRAGLRQDGVGNLACDGLGEDSTESTRVPDQQTRKR
jgi:hypothetical protein